MLLCKTIPWGFLLPKILYIINYTGYFQENVKKKIPKPIHFFFPVFNKNTKQFINP